MTVYNEHGWAIGVKRKWDIEDVVQEYDSNLNITLTQLAKKSGWDYHDLIKLLMTEQ